MANTEQREMWALYVPIDADTPTCIVGMSSPEIDAQRGYFSGEWALTLRALLGPGWRTRLDAGLKKVRK